MGAFPERYVISSHPLTRFHSPDRLGWENGENERSRLRIRVVYYYIKSGALLYYEWWCIIIILRVVYYYN